MPDVLKDLRVKPGQAPELSKSATLPERTGEDFKEEVKRNTAKLSLKLAELQELLYAQRKHRILVVIQGLDTSGKDGSVRNVFSGVSPEGIRVVAFKAPTPPELEHDYLWRVHDKVPANGEIVVFNRSHYEDVLVARVHDLVPEKVWRRRYRHILEFERMLAEEGTTILKFFLNISKDEQKKRLETRLTQKNKNWKWDPSDLRDRQRWSDFLLAYEEALQRTSTEEAPWFVVPADKKWWRDYCVAATLVSALEDLKMEYPKPKLDVASIHLD